MSAEQRGELMSRWNELNTQTGNSQERQRFMIMLKGEIEEYLERTKPVVKPQPKPEPACGFLKWLTFQCF